MMLGKEKNIIINFGTFFIPYILQVYDPFDPPELLDVSIKSYNDATGEKSSIRTLAARVDVDSKIVWVNKASIGSEFDILEIILSI